MPHIRTSGSTPETRRRELLILKSSSIDGRIRSAVEEAKNVVRNSVQGQSSEAKRLSFAEERLHTDLYESVSTFPPIHRVSATILFDKLDENLQDHLRVSSIAEEIINLSRTLSIYEVELVKSDNDDDDEDDDGENNRRRFVSYISFEANTSIRSDHCRTNSLLSSPVIFDLANPMSRRSSSLVQATVWQNHPQKILLLFDRVYHYQSLSPFLANEFLLSNSTHIDIYNIRTGLCEEQICFQSPNVNYIALCYNQFKNQLLVASTLNLYIYDLFEHKVLYEIRLPGFPFHLDTNPQLRYLACNSSSIYHGYFSFTATCTSTILSRLSQFEYKHVCDLEFDDGTMHGLHATEKLVGIVIRYGRYSSRRSEDYCLYIYDYKLDQIIHSFDLNNIGFLTSLTCYERTLDWICCDYEKQRLIFINQESIEYIQFHESIHQCTMLNDSNMLLVWLTNRIFVYTID